MRDRRYGPPAQPGSGSVSLARGMRLSAVGDDPELALFVADTLKALSHPIRIRIIAILVQGSQHVNALAERLGVTQAIVSQQLRILRMRRLVSVDRSEGFAYYSLAEPRLKELVRCMESCTVR